MIGVLIIVATFKRAAYAVGIAENVLRRRGDGLVLPGRSAQPRDAIGGEPANSCPGESLRAKTPFSQCEAGDPHTGTRAAFSGLPRDPPPLWRGPTGTAPAGH